MKTDRIIESIFYTLFYSLGHSSREAEVGARLSCHLLLMLFQSVEGTTKYGSGIKHSCDRQLLGKSTYQFFVIYALELYFAYFLKAQLSLVLKKSRSKN